MVAILGTRSCLASSEFALVMSVFYSFPNKELWMQV